jgi:hypothetical protein
VQWQEKYTILTPIWLADRLRLYIKLPVPMGDTTARWCCYLLMNAKIAVEGHEEANMYAPWQGVVWTPYTALTLPLKTHIEDTRSDEASYGTDRVFISAFGYYLDQNTGEPVIEWGATCGWDGGDYPIP